MPRPRYVIRHEPTPVPGLYNVLFDDGKWLYDLTEAQVFGILSAGVPRDGRTSLTNQMLEEIRKKKGPVDREGRPIHFRNATHWPLEVTAPVRCGFCEEPIFNSGGLEVGCMREEINRHRDVCSGAGTLGQSDRDAEGTDDGH